MVIGSYGYTAKKNDYVLITRVDIKDYDKFEKSSAQKGAIQMNIINHLAKRLMLIFVSIMLIACTQLDFGVNKRAEMGGWQAIVHRVEKVDSMRAPGVMAWYEPEDKNFVFLLIEVELIEPNETRISFSSKDLVLIDNQEISYLPVGVGRPLRTMGSYGIEYYAPAFLLNVAINDLPEGGTAYPSSTAFRDGRTETIEIQEDSWITTIEGPITPHSFLATYIYMVPENATGFDLDYLDLPAIEIDFEKSYSTTTFIFEEPETKEPIPSEKIESQINSVHRIEQHEVLVLVMELGIKCERNQIAEGWEYYIHPISGNTEGAVIMLMNSKNGEKEEYYIDIKHNAILTDDSEQTIPYQFSDNRFEWIAESTRKGECATVSVEIGYELISDLESIQFQFQNLSPIEIEKSEVK